MLRHIPSEKALRIYLSPVLEKARSIPGQVSGQAAVDFNIKQIRSLLVQWRDHEIRSQDMLSAVNDILDGHGIEYLESINRRAKAYYVNMGDPYITTILLDLPRNRIWTTGWGNYVESEERQHNRFA